MHSDADWTAPARPGGSNWDDKAVFEGLRNSVLKLAEALARRLSGSDAPAWKGLPQDRRQDLLRRACTVAGLSWQGVRTCILLSKAEPTPLSPSEAFIEQMVGAFRDMTVEERKAVAWNFCRHCLEYTGKDACYCMRDD